MDPLKSSHQRHQSLPSCSTPTKSPAVMPQKLPLPSKSQTTSKLNDIQSLQSLKDVQLYENIVSSSGGNCSSLENSINNNSSVPYENINLEHISVLMAQGYSREDVFTALAVSRNNLEMAIEILNVMFRFS